MKHSKKVLVSTLISASLCSSVTDAISPLGWASIGVGSLFVVGAPIAVVVDSRKNGDKKPGVAVHNQPLGNVATVSDKFFVPNIFDYDVISNELLHDSLEWGSEMNSFITECVGKKNFEVLKKFGDSVYCHGNISKDRLDINKILKMSFERVGSGMEGVKVLSNGEIANFLSNPSNKEDVEFAYYAMARCLDPFHRSKTYKKLCKVVRNNCKGFEFRADTSSFGYEEDAICSVYINSVSIELRYQSYSRAFKCVISLK